MKLSSVPRRGVLVCFIVLLAAQAICIADMQVQTYQPNRQDRFYVGSDKDFVGADFDFSGVGQVNGGTWATMISPTYFLSAAHWPPGGGNVITFHQDNNPTGPTYQATVDNWSFQTNYGGIPSDLWLGRLTTPIPTSAHIAYYPVLSLPSQSDYLGMLIYVNGKPNRVGRNNISNIRVASEPEDGTHYKSTVSMEFDYKIATDLGADECFLIGGDSGGPSFVNAGGKLALVGIHYYNYGTPDVMNWGDISGDSFVPYYISQLNANMVGQSVTTAVLGDTNGDGLVNSLDIDAIYQHFWAAATSQWKVAADGLAVGQQDVTYQLQHILHTGYGDANLDRKVDLLDFQALLDNWQLSSNWATGDLTGDGKCDFLDFQALLDNWNPNGFPTAPVPEPASAALLMLGALAMLRRNRK